MNATILVVDDSESARSSIRRILEEAELNLRVMEASDGAEALPLALSGSIDMVISDIVMPRLDGIELLRGIRQQRDPESLPVILVTSQVDAEIRSTSFESGASDYISKPFSAHELIGRIQVQLRLRNLQDDLRRANDRFRELGLHDDLTGLANRRHFFDLCRRELARSRRHKFAMSIAMIDIDRFRRVNSKVGYLAGDAIITEMAQVLARNLRSSDILSRVSGEKFAALLPQADQHEARVLTERLCDTVRGHSFPGHQLSEVTLSIGTATYPSGRLESVDELVNAAEASLDRAKELGGSRAEIWDAIEPPPTSAESS